VHDDGRAVATMVPSIVEIVMPSCNPTNTRRKAREDGSGAPG
jgi:hypothetical protein